MSSLDNLMNLEGAAAAFEYASTGELTDYRVADGSDLNADTLDLLAHMFVANIAIATMQATKKPFQLLAALSLLFQFLSATFHQFHNMINQFIVTNFMIGHAI